MTTPQLITVTCLYAVFLAVVVYFTRPRFRRFASAAAGGVAAALSSVAAIQLGEQLQLWRGPVLSSDWMWLPLTAGVAVSMAPINLITWRVARRYGARGLAVVHGVAGVVGPVRDYRVTQTYPEWMELRPGITPLIAIGVVYVALIAIGHGVMRLVAGPARSDRLARE
jgi:hypothetical protein